MRSRSSPAPPPSGRFAAPQSGLESGQVLRRGNELGPILAPLERRLMKVVAG
jgi:hypothetical protein